MITNALTVDVEDYIHVSAFANAIPRKDWNNIPLRVEQNTHRLLQLFGDCGAKATFFMLGWVAERVPQLIREISESGHEVASHGYSHRLVYNQTPKEFREETIRSKSLIEDQAQLPVYGYRAASYSITERSKWALDILAEQGFIYDSSIFPIRHDIYGIPDSPEYPYQLKTPDGHSIVEFPLSTARILGMKLPIAGGGYFRLYPYSLTKYGLSRINKLNKPFIFYLHPWEIDPEQPRVNAGTIARFRHYNNLDKCESRLKSLLQDFSFDTTMNVLDQLGLTHANGTVSKVV